MEVGSEYVWNAYRLQANLTTKRIGSILNVISLNATTLCHKYSVYSLRTHLPQSPIFLPQQSLNHQILEQEFLLVHLSRQKKKGVHSFTLPDLFCDQSNNVSGWCLIILTDIFGSMYTFKSDLMVGYFFQIATAYRGCTLGIATRAFSLRNRK